MTNRPEWTTEADRERDTMTGARTERRLDGHKLFVSYNDDGNVVVHAVTDGRPPTRLVFEMGTDEAREFISDLLGAARLAEGEHCQECGAAYDTVYWLPDDIWALITPKPDNAGAGLLCPTCADKRARRAGIYLKWEATVDG